MARNKQRWCWTHRAMTETNRQGECMACIEERAEKERQEADEREIIDPDTEPLGHDVGGGHRVIRSTRHLGG